MIDIFGTLGPACDDIAVLTDMFSKGMTGIRVNLSHVMLNAVLDGAASVMVTGETAIGVGPTEVIMYLSNTAIEAEKYIGEEGT